MQYLGATSEKAEWSQFISKANHSASQKSKSMPQPPMVKKLKWSVLWSDDYDLKVLWPKRPAKTNIKNRCPIYRKGLECKSRKSRDTQSDRQVWPWSTKWSRVQANRVLPKECFGHSKHPLPTTQEKTLHIDITRWSIIKSHWLYSLQPKMKKLFTVSKNKTRSWLWLRSWTPYCQIQT